MLSKKTKGFSGSINSPQATGAAPSVLDGGGHLLPYMKRKALIALCPVTLFTFALVFLSAHPSVHFTGPFAPKYVKEIQRGVRQEMWRRAFPRFSMQTIAAAPKLLWSLATSRVEQID